MRRLSCSTRSSMTTCHPTTITSTSCRTGSCTCSPTRRWTTSTRGSIWKVSRHRSLRTCARCRVHHRCRWRRCHLRSTATKRVVQTRPSRISARTRIGTWPRASPAIRTRDDACARRGPAEPEGPCGERGAARSSVVATHDIGIMMSHFMSHTAHVDTYTYTYDVHTHTYTPLSRHHTRSSKYLKLHTSLTKLVRVDTQTHT
mmetsp:Transcript_8363/g.21593  ORF Transcript_8363/g.21593 Transcript_8363/m.21593 type:complete len:202 (-) Transcript_8363:29-634(-)